MSFAIIGASVVLLADRDVGGSDEQFHEREDEVGLPVGRHDTRGQVQEWQIELQASSWGWRLYRFPPGGIVSMEPTRR